MIAVLSIDGVKVGVEQADVRMNEKLDRLIRDDRITPMMATSLLNDSGYAYELGNALITTLEGLFGTTETEGADVGDDLRLGEQLIEEVATADLASLPDDEVNE